MTSTDQARADQVRAIFADVRQVHAQALERLEQGDVRDAAEKAWCATKRATDALILARTPVGSLERPARPGGSWAGWSRKTRPSGHPAIATDLWSAADLPARRLFL